MNENAAEKLLKGYLIRQGWGLRKTHDIVTLLAECTEYNDAFGKMAADSQSFKRARDRLQSEVLVG